MKNNKFTYEYNEDEGLVAISASGVFITELLSDGGDPEVEFNWFIDAYERTSAALQQTNNDIKTAILDELQASYDSEYNAYGDGSLPLIDLDSAKCAVETHLL